MNEYEFLVCCKENLHSNYWSTLLQLLEEHEELLGIVGWELVSAIGLSLKDKSKESLQPLLPVLTKLQENCAAKEFLLGITESLSPNVINSLEKFQFVCDLTVSAFVSLQRGQEKQLTDVWHRLLSCCQSLLSDADNEERKTNSFQIVVSFIKTLIDRRLAYTRHNDLSQYLMECSSGHLGWTDLCVRRCRKQIILWFSVSAFDAQLEDDVFVLILKIPIGKFNIFEILELVGEAWKKFENIPADLVSNLITCIFDVTDLQELINLFDKTKANHPCGVILFFQHVLVDDKYENEVPVVYRKEAIFQFLSPFIVASLGRRDDIFVDTSLKLLGHSVSCIADGSFDDEFSRAGYFLLQRLCKVMIWSELECHRKNSKYLFDSLRKKFHQDVQYELYCKLYDDTEHPGLRGYLISLIKETLILEIKEKNFDEKIRTEIAKLCTKFLHVDLTETNVLRDSDRLMAGLNFARYWLLYNATEFQKVLKLQQHLDLIQRCIRVSSDSLKESQERNNQGKEGIPIELVMASGIPIDQLPKDEQSKALTSAQSTLDMMSCVIARLYEILEGR